MPRQSFFKKRKIINATFLTKKKSLCWQTKNFAKGGDFCVKYIWKVRQVVEDNISPPVCAFSPMKSPGWDKQTRSALSPLFFVNLYLISKRSSGLHYKGTET